MNNKEKFHKALDTYLDATVRFEKAWGIHEKAKADYKKAYAEYIKHNTDKMMGVR